MYDLTTLSQMNAKAVLDMTMTEDRRRKIMLAIPVMIYEFMELPVYAEEAFLDKWTDFLVEL